ncbi:MAG: hypothetical protein FJ276_03175 [Planctomycetes bacterium]|nr:hypothetical protein [Planctomycetota bacterium]
MFRVFLTGLLLAAAVAAQASAAAPNPAPAKTIDELTKDVQLLQQQVADLQAMRQLLATTSENVTTVADQVAKNTKALLDLSGEYNDNLTRQQVVVEDLREVVRALQEENAKQQQILEAISEMDSSGRRVPAIRANMRESADFRTEMQDAVQQSLKAQGKLTINNKTGTYQYVSVNRVDYGVDPGDSLQLTVPVGTVTVQLPGQRLTNWTVTGPSYAQSIDIVPDLPVVRTTTYMTPPAPVYLPPAPVYLPPAPVYVSPPIYLGAPVTWYVR